MAIKEEYVSEFIPIHQLDNLGPNTQWKDGKLVLADLSSDDLFIVSKLCAHATDERNAIMVSKSLKYGNLRDRLSDDCQIQKMKDDIHEISVNLCEFSCDMYLCAIPFLSTYTELCCTNISTELKNDIIWISGTYVPSVSNDITEIIEKVSSDIDDKKTDKQKNVTISSSLEGYFIKSFEFDEDGHVKELQNHNIDAVSNYITIDGMKVAGGTIAGDTTTISTLVLQNGNTREIRYCVNEDCYLTMGLSVLEDDSCNKPLELWICNVLSGEEVHMRLGQFNNPGGFSGTRYFNYYYDGFPIKQQNDTDGENRSVTSVYVKYQDGSEFLYDEDNRSVFEFSEHPFYATVAKSELSNYIQRNPTTRENSKKLYKIATDGNGLVIDAEEYKTSDIAKDIPSPTSSQPGTIKTGTSNNFTVNPQIQGVRVDGNRNAYVNISAATKDTYGTIKIGMSNNIASQQYGLNKNNNGYGYVQISTSTPNTYGTVKVFADTAKQTADKKSGYLRVPVKIDSNGQLYVDILEGRTSTSSDYSILKTFNDTTSTESQRWLRSNNDGFGFITIPKATTSGRGTVKLGTSSKEGQVYEDASDGIIKVGFGNKYLATSGGTMTGSIKTNVANAIITDQNGTGKYVRICGGTDNNNGAFIVLNNKSYSTQNPLQNGTFEIRANNGSAYSSLSGTPSGSLTWNGEEIITTGNIMNQTLIIENGYPLLDYGGRMKIPLSRGKSYQLPFHSLIHVGDFSGKDPVYYISKIDGTSVSDMKAMVQDVFNGYLYITKGTVITINGSTSTYNIEIVPFKFSEMEEGSYRKATGKNNIQSMQQAITNLQFTGASIASKTSTQWKFELSSDCKYIAVLKFFENEKLKFTKSVPAGKSVLTPSTSYWSTFEMYRITIPEVEE